MKNFIMGLILAVLSIGASVALSISEDQLRRIAAIALEQQEDLYREGPVFLKKEN